MSGYHYQISEASRLLAVEAHVLRYWEEELGMVIPRNEMGHRYYTEEHLRIFSQIKDMKERGYQLRAIRAILSGEEPPEPLITEIPLRKDQKEPKSEFRSEQLDAPGQAVVTQPEQNSNPVKIPGTGPASVPDPGALPPTEIPLPDRETPPGIQPQTPPGAQPDTQTWSPDQAPVPTDENSADTRMNQFQAVMTHIVAQAMLCNNPGLAKDISKRVETDLISEIKRMMNSSESRQEERFRKLDESIRAIQQGNRARYEAAAAKSPGLFGRKRRRKKYRRL